MRNKQATRLQLAKPVPSRVRDRRQPSLMVIYIVNIRLQREWQRSGVALRLFCLLNFVVSKRFDAVVLKLCVQFVLVC
jgi:hypothetical protein